MRAFASSVIISGVSTKVDGGLSVRLVLPELSPEEKAAVFELQNCELKMLLQQEGDNPAKYTEVKGEFDRKTKSQRLRAIMFVEFQDRKPDGLTFEDYYNREMERLIESRKQTLPPPRPPF